MSAPATLTALVQWRAASCPSRSVYTFLRDGETPEATLTYGEIDRAARALAACLQSRAAPGARVALVVPTGPEFVTALFGCLYAGMVAIPLAPPDADRDLRRLTAVLADARPALGLLTEPVARALRAHPSGPHVLAAVPWLAADTIDDAGARGWRDPGSRSCDAALLQYTSGSTGSPRGVRLSHANVLANQRLIQDAFEHTAESVVVGWLPLHHDMGLIGNLLQPLYVGARCVLMAPSAFLRRPERWLRAISRHRGTTAGAPNSAYDLCVARIPERAREGLDLGSWSVAYNGAEPVRAATLDRFAAAFAPHGFRREAFYPCYGLAEATLIVTGGRRGDAPLVRWFASGAVERGAIAETSPHAPGARPLVSNGRARDGVSVAIVDPETSRRQDAGRVGEVWLTGPTVGAPAHDGDASFGTRLDGDERPYLRTGDLGFLLESELFITARLKDVVIVRGRNLAPADVESTVAECHAAIRAGCVAVFPVEADDEEKVGIACGTDLRRDDDPHAVIAAIRGAVAEEHGVEVALVALLRPAAVPRTTSGKIQRRQCRALVLEGGVEPIAAWREPSPVASIESPPDPPVHPREWLASQLERRTGVPRAEVDAHRPLAQYGLGSIGVAELISAAEEHFGAHIPWSRLLEAPTLASLAAAVSRSDDDAKRAPAAEAPRPSPGVFIPARENRLVLAAARLGVRRLFRKHFHAVWLRRGYTPADRTTRTVYVLNHTSWWDFCIPFLLDDRLFRQRARYMMSHDVMSARWHARLLLPRAGVFSIRLDDEALRVASLRYAADFMRVEGRSFYLYPQGKIHPESDEIRFQDGVGWLHARLPGADFVPVACHLHTLRTARPQLYLSVGEGVQIDARVGIGERTRVLEASCRDLVRDLRALAHDATRLDRDKGFERLR